MRTLFVALFLIFFYSASAQYQVIKKNVAVGMYVHIKTCKTGASNFQYIDLYTKTRYPDTGIMIDTLTGDGVFENFFAPGDFDAKRLPAAYGENKYKIAALRIFDDPDDKTGKAKKRVMICYTGDKMSLIWIEVDKALTNKEIEF